WRFQDHMGYFSALGDGFLSGHLYLPETPPAALVLDSNPYDPAHRDALRAQGHTILHDASLFKGHYYLYFGPVPGFVHALWRLLFRGSLSDSLAQLLAGLTISVTFAQTLHTIRHRFAPASSETWVWGSAVAFGLGGIMPFMVGRPSVYHEAILIGLSFLILAWHCLLKA